MAPLSFCLESVTLRFCGASWIRTSDTRIFSPLLYQLSYGNSKFLSRICCSPILWCQLDSNQRHKDFQSFALPTELWHLPQSRFSLDCVANLYSFFEI